MPGCATSSILAAVLRRTTRSAFEGRLSCWLSLERYSPPTSERGRQNNRRTDRSDLGVQARAWLISNAHQLRRVTAVPRCGREIWRWEVVEALAQCGIESTPLPRKCTPLSDHWIIIVDEAELRAGHRA